MMALDFVIGMLLFVIGLLAGVLAGLWIGERLFFYDRRHLDDK